MRTTTVFIIVLTSICTGTLSPNASAQDRSKYPTHLNASGSGIDWVEFYDRADALTAETRKALKHHLDIPYGEDPKQKLDLYLPDGKPSGPVFIFIHGGGFVEGDRSHYGYVARPLAKHGIMTAVISYRLSPQHYPAQVEDVLASLEWVYHNIAEHGGDPSRIYIGGHSAGAILSAFVSVDPSWVVSRSLPKDLIKGYVPVSGPYDLRTPGGFVDNYLPDDRRRAEASPLLNIHDLSASAVVAVGSQEKPYLESSMAFVDAINQKSSNAELLVLEGMTHDATALAAGDDDGPLVAAVIKMIGIYSGSGTGASQAQVPATVTEITIENQGWLLHGDFRVGGAVSAPAVLMLHRAAGDRSEYAALGQALAERGIASLALDLRGHGESANQGRFEEPYAENRHINQGAHSDIGTALDWLARRNDVDSSRLAVVAASYSGEQAGIAFRQDIGKAAAYVMLSPGNFSDASIKSVDGSGSSWLFVRTAKESPVSREFIDAVFTAVESGSSEAERWIIPGEGHATRMLEGRPELIIGIADWIADALSDLSG